MYTRSRMKMEYTRIRIVRRASGWLCRKVQRARQERCPCSKGSLAATATANPQGLLPVEPSQLLVVQADAFPVEHGLGQQLLQLRVLVLVLESLTLAEKGLLHQVLVPEDGEDGLIS